MKIFTKSAILVGTVVACSTLTSCNLDDPENINTFTFDVLNLISTDGDDENVLLTPSSYSFRLDGNKHLLRIESSNILFDNANHTVSTADIRYSAQGFMTPYQSGSIVSFDTGSSDVSKSGSEPVSEVAGTLNSTAWPADKLTSTLVMSYRLGSNRTVRTLSSNAYFVGESTISGAKGDPVKTGDPVYRVVIDPTTMRAQIAIGFLPLRDLEEKVSLILRNLKVTPKADGYTISSDETVAEVSNNLGDHSWKFTNVEFKTTDETLTRAKISFTLPGEEGEETYNVTAPVCYTLF